MNLCDDDVIRALLARHDFHFSKAMGQNFLIDANVPAAIAEASGADKSCGVLEIGPGIGALTQQLAQQAGKVVSVELDRSLLPVLAESMAPFPNVRILSGDVMKLDLSALCAEQFAGYTPMVCANLPYNITTPVLTKLSETPCFSSVTVLVQREAALRVCAPPGTPECGVSSLLLQYRMEMEILFDVPRECFLPAPKVTSSVMRCVRRKTPPVDVPDEALLFRVIRGAYLLRRKTLLNSLASALPGYPKDVLREAVLSAGLPEGVRGERLSLQDFAEITKFLHQQKK